MEFAFADALKVQIAVVIFTVTYVTFVLVWAKIIIIVMNEKGMEDKNCIKRVKQQKEINLILCEKQNCNVHSQYSSKF